MPLQLSNAVACLGRPCLNCEPPVSWTHPSWLLASMDWLMYEWWHICTSYHTDMYRSVTNVDNNRLLDYYWCLSPLCRAARTQRDEISVGQ